MKTPIKKGHRVKWAAIPINKSYRREYGHNIYKVTAVKDEHIQIDGGCEWYHVSRFARYLEKGSLEWAIEMMECGNLVEHDKYGDNYFAISSALPGMYISFEHQSGDRLENLVRSGPEYGWRLYGKLNKFAHVSLHDFVEITGKRISQVSKVTQKGFTIDELGISFNLRGKQVDIHGKEVSGGNRVIRIIQPQDMEVTVSLTGKVKEWSDSRFALISGEHECTIGFTAIDRSTANLARDILAAIKIQSNPIGE